MTGNIDTCAVTEAAPQVEIAVRDERQPVWYLGAQSWLLVLGTSTGGAFGMVEMLLGPGTGTPMHIHHKEAEGLYIIEGRLRVVCGDGEWEAGLATWMLLPRGVPHGIQAVGEIPCRFLEFFLPGGLEMVSQEIDALVSSGRTDLASMKKIAEPYGLELLGPLPAPSGSNGSGGTGGG